MELEHVKKTKKKQCDFNRSGSDKDRQSAGLLRHLQGHSLSGSGTIAVTLLLVGQMLRVPVQRRQLVREPQLHELHEPGEASTLEGPASLPTQDTADLLWVSFDGSRLTTKQITSK